MVIWLSSPEGRTIKRRVPSHLTIFASNSAVALGWRLFHWREQMALCDLKLSIDMIGLHEMLSSLSDISDRFPEFRDSLLGLLNSGEELFAIDDQDRTAPRAGDLVVGFKPTDSLLNLISAFRASHPDFLIFKHDKPPSGNSA
nr:hypothetical protein [Brucella intermedia]